MLDLQSIPPTLRTARDPLFARIEDAALAASQPREQAFHDGWLLRYANGKAKRARSVNMIGAGERPLDEKLAYCSAFYARHGLPLIFRLTPFAQPPGIDAALAERGFIADEDTRVMVAPLDAASPAPEDGAAPEAVDRADFGAILAALHDLDPARAAVERARFALSVVDGIYLALRDGGRPVACGCAVLDGDLAGVFGMVTAPSRRGQGFATRIVTALLGEARSRGCTTAYLQVAAGNAPARSVYSRFGFRDGYACWYRMPPLKETP